MFPEAYELPFVLDTEEMYAARGLFPCLTHLLVLYMINKIFISLLAGMASASHGAAMTADQSDAMAGLASSCIHKEYPNVVKHYFSGPQDVRSPKEMHPVFYGCLDWHSSVHGHWLLVRLLNTNPDLSERAKIIEQLDQSFNATNIGAELAYFNRPGSGTSYERPYGLAWFLQLTAELRQWQDPMSQKWLKALLPLENKIVSNVEAWLPKLAYPIRVGEHSQTAFAFGLMLDWARVANNKKFELQLSQRVKDYYAADQNCPLAYEPSGQDFLSPCLAEADLMRRVMAPKSYSKWLGEFLPMIPKDGSGNWIKLATVTDRSDGKLAHLDGLNLSRTWMLDGIASALPDTDKRKKSIIAAANTHREGSLPVVMGDLHYMGSHWLGSFATYLITDRGL